MRKMTRREFLRLTGLGVSALAAQQFLSACTSGDLDPNTDIPITSSVTPTALQPEATPIVENTTLLENPYIVVAHGKNVEQVVSQGMNALGGMRRFMNPGADVIIKPNICVPYNTYEYAATTNPWVIGALVKLCLEAGAKRVRVMDYPFGGPAEECYQVSGIAEQVLAAGGQMEVMLPLKYETVSIPNAVKLKKVTVYQDVLTTDLLIDVPIAKNHGMAGLTLGLKNLMGTIQNREQIHPSFEKNLVDLATLVRPHLTVIDAMRTLMENGPTGGNLADVKIQDTVIFSHDTVLADSYATTLFGKRPTDFPYIMKAAERGLGITDWNSVKFKEFNVTV